MPEYLSPGVYVEEFESGGQSIAGVSTSTGGFLGMAEKGATKGAPQLVTSIADYQRKFGGHLSEFEYGEGRYMPLAVEQFFINGGARCYVMRVAPEDAECANSDHVVATSKMFSVKSKNVGEWGNKITVRLSKSNKVKTQVLKKAADDRGVIGYTVKSAAGFSVGDTVEFVQAVAEGEAPAPVYNKITGINDKVLNFAEEFPDDIVDEEPVPTKLIQSCGIKMEIFCEDSYEAYEYVSDNKQATDFIEKILTKSELVSLKYLEGETEDFTTLYALMAEAKDHVILFSLAEGKNGNVSTFDKGVYLGKDGTPGNRTGIFAFLENTDVSIMLIPGITDANVQLSLVAHCENLASRFAILDIEKDITGTNELGKVRDKFDTQYAAVYHPWIEVYDSLAKKNIYMPPSGAVAGIYARTDIQRGVHKAPANEVVKGCTGLSCNYNKGEQDVLNPKGINLLRAFQGQGIRVWGARTLSSNSNWRYINVRRTFIMIEESIKASTNWVVFEPNDAVLWAKVQLSIESFLTTLWRNGILAGTTTGEAFFVDIGTSTMTQDDIDNGRLICVIGVAPQKPAEFVIFRITQKAALA